MAEIKTREKSKGIKALDKAVVAGERMKRAFVRSKDQAENLLDDGQISPSEYAEDKVRYMAEDTAREVGHEAGKLTGKAKSACRSHREAKRTAYLCPGALSESADLHTGGMRGLCALK